MSFKAFAEQTSLDFDFKSDYDGDRFFGIHCPVLHYGQLTPTKYGDAIDTVATKYKTIIEVFSYLKGLEDYGLMDVGCGQGRVLCVAQALGFKRLYGIEPNIDAFDLAKNNLEIHRFRNQRFFLEILNKDVLDIDLRKANIFYLYQPFWEDSSRHFMRLLKLEYIKKPWPILLIVGGNIKDIFLQESNDFLISSQAPQDYYILSSPDFF